MYKKDGLLVFMHVDMLFWAFRYALGRRSYAVHEVAGEILRRWQVIPDGMKKNMVSEIMEAIQHDKAGDQIDIDMWNKVVQKYLDEQVIE